MTSLSQGCQSNLFRGLALLEVPWKGFGHEFKSAKLPLHDVMVSGSPQCRAVGVMSSLEGVSGPFTWVALTGAAPGIVYGGPH